MPPSTRSRRKSNRGWTSENIRIAKAVSNKHAALVWICNRSAKRVERRQKVTGVIIAAGLYLFGTTGIPSVLSNSEANNTNEIILIIICVLAVGFGLFKTVIVALQEDKTVGKNRWALGIHAELTKDIRKELNKKPHKRNLWRKFYKELEEKDIELQKDAPTPPKAVLKAYYAQFGENAIEEHILFGGLNDIENAHEITVQRQKSSMDIGSVAKGNRLRKKEIREIIDHSLDGSDGSEDPEDSASIRKAESASEPSVPTEVTSSSTDSSIKRERAKTLRKAQRKAQRKARKTVDATAEASDQSSTYSSSQTESGCVPHIPAPISPPASPRRKMTLDRRRVAAIAARHDMRDRYELERYYLE